MKFEIKAYNLQELGQRQNQEDSLYPALGQSTNDDRLFILCDGMGGHEKGEVASATVCEVMSKTILSMWNPSEPLSDEIFQKALAASYDALDAKDNGEERKMGTTMTFVCLHSEGATVAHIGDSRVYQLRPAKNGNPAKIVFRTQDHSLVNDLVKIGEITEEEAKHHPQKNVITRAMQPCQDHRAKVDIAHLTDIQPGDYFYMCSDGMLEEATDENILNIITMPSKTDSEKIEMLRNVTEENKDNHTAHLICIDSVYGTNEAKESQVQNFSECIQGTLVETEFEDNNTPASPKISAKNGKMRTKRNIVPLIVCIAILAAIIAGITFFNSSKNNDIKLKTDSINKDISKDINKGQEKGKVNSINKNGTLMSPDSVSNKKLHDSFSTQSNKNSANNHAQCTKKAPNGSKDVENKVVDKKK
jgi:PPM family protein phosphatase